MYSSIDARSLRSEEFRSLFDPTQSSNYFARPSMLIKQTALDTELNKRELSRKHVPYEPSSLFRCLAESLYCTQFQWKRVKSEVLDYLDSFLVPTIKEEVAEGESEKALEHKQPEEASEEKVSEEKVSEEKVSGQEAGGNGAGLDNNAIVVGQVNGRDLSKITALVESIDEVKDSLDPGPTFDQSMDLLPFVADYYKVKMIVFREDEPDAEPIVFLPRDRIIGVDSLSGEQLIHRLTISPSGHFDRVLTFEKVLVLSLTQSIVYENLFTEIFGCPEEVVKKTVKEMLHDKKYSKLRMERKRFARERDAGREAGDTCDLPDELAALPPISYKTAKAMDMSVYRNVTMDYWLQKNKDRFIGMKIAELEPNSKCMVTFKPHGVRCTRSGQVGKKVVGTIVSCTRSDQVGKKVVGTIVSKNEDNLFEVELLPSGRVVSVGLDQLELLSKRKERKASYYSGSQSRVITPYTGSQSRIITPYTGSQSRIITPYTGSQSRIITPERSITIETVVEEPMDTTHDGLDTNFPPLQRFPPTKYWCPPTKYCCPPTKYWCPPAYHRPPYSFPTADGYGMYGTVPNRFIPIGYQTPFVSLQSQGATMPQPPVYQGATMPQPPVYVTQPSMVSCSPPTYTDDASYPTPMFQPIPIPSVPPQVLVHSGPIWLPASPPLTPFNPSMNQAQVAAQGWRTYL